MKNRRKTKDFDTVKMMREIRDKLSKKYSSNPEKEIEELEKVRSKYSSGKLVKSEN